MSAPLTRSALRALAACAVAAGRGAPLPELDLRSIYVAPHRPLAAPGLPRVPRWAED